jgi:hypothetical protein
MERASRRALEVLPRRREVDRQAELVLATGRWREAALAGPPELAGRIAVLAADRLWERRAEVSSAEVIDLRRFVGCLAHRWPTPETQDTWFLLAALLANTLRIGGQHRDARRLLELLRRHLGVGLRAGRAGDVRRRFRRESLLLRFESTLQFDQDRWEKALDIVNREIVKRRLLSGEDIGQAYAKRAGIRADLAFGVSASDERARLYALALADVQRCLEAGTDPFTLAATVNSAALWLAREGELDRAADLTARIPTLVDSAASSPVAACRRQWAWGLVLAGRGDLAAGDAQLARAFATLQEHHRHADAALVAIDRVRIRLRARQPQDVPRLLLEIRRDLVAERLTDEARRSLEVLWAACIRAATSGAAGEPIEAMVFEAQRAVVRGR